MIALRVAARFQRRLADQAPGGRQHAKRLTKPVNAPKGISKEIVKENGEYMMDHPIINRRDIQPADVFNLTPNNAGVLNYVETGKDLQHAIDKGVPRDKGYDTVYNLSQFLIRTQGGGDGKPAGKKS
jgi:hypothetical protein